jgi:predicted CoA-binding protein
MTSKAAIDAFVAQPALALVRISRSGGKFGNLACRELARKGYRVYPIHPSADAIDGLHTGGCGGFWESSLRNCSTRAI